MFKKNWFVFVVSMLLIVMSLSSAVFARTITEDEIIKDYDLDPSSDVIFNNCIVSKGALLEGIEHCHIEPCVDIPNTCEVEIYEKCKLHLTTLPLPGDTRFVYAKTNNIDTYNFKLDVTGGFHFNQRYYIDTDILHLTTDEINNIKYNKNNAFTLNNHIDLNYTTISGNKISIICCELKLYGDTTKKVFEPDIDIIEDTYYNNEKHTWLVISYPYNQAFNFRLNSIDAVKYAPDNMLQRDSDGKLLYWENLVGDDLWELYDDIVIDHNTGEFISGTLKKNPETETPINTVSENISADTHTDTVEGFEVTYAHSIPFYGKNKLTTKSFGDFTVSYNGTTYPVAKVKVNKGKKRIQILSLKGATKAINKKIKAATKGAKGLTFTVTPYYVKDSDTVTPKKKKDGSISSVKIKINGKYYKVKKDDWTFDSVTNTISFTGVNVNGSYKIS